MEIGDRIVYPMHGAGIIAGVETNEIGGVTKSYYVLKMPMGNLKLMLPVDKINEIGLRGIIDRSKVAEVKAVLEGAPEYTVGSWNKRYHATLERLKSGDILDAAAVARNLSAQNARKKLSSGERRLLDLARQILISELVFACEKPPEEIERWLDEILGVFEGGDDV